MKKKPLLCGAQFEREAGCLLGVCANLDGGCVRFERFFAHGGECSEIVDTCPLFLNGSILQSSKKNPFCKKPNYVF
jgi:hypothetical protein